MKTTGRILGILALIGMSIGMLPFLGWLNWLNIPLSVIGLLISIIGKTKGAIIMCSAAIFFGLIRLFLGAGII